METKTDSKYVVDGCTKHRHGLVRGWCNRKCRELWSGDLWDEVDGLLDAHPGWAVRFVKVKVHSTWDDMATGGVSEVDKIGDDAANALAVAHVAPIPSGE